MEDLCLGVGPQDRNPDWTPSVPAVGIPRTPRERTLEEIQVIADQHRVRVSDILGPSRRLAILPARFETYAYLYFGRGWTKRQIGRFVGGRDHSTVWNGLRRLEGAEAKRRR